MKKRYLIVLLAAFFSLSKQVPAQPCSGKVITPGANKNDVTEICGKPFFRDKRRVKYKATDARKRIVKSVRIEEWGYHFNANGLAMVVTYENGRVATVKEDRPRRCGEASIPPGATKSVLFLICGKPESIREREEEIYLGDTEEGREGMHRIEFIQEWIYEGGARRFVFRDGKLQL